MTEKKLKIWLVLADKVFYDEGKTTEITPEELKLFKRCLLFKIRDSDYWETTKQEDKKLKNLLKKLEKI